MNSNLLIISPIAFHDDVANAGARTVNYYYKKFSAQNQIQATVAYLGDEDNDYRKMKFQYPEMKAYVSFNKKNVLQKGYDFIRFNILYPLYRTVIPKYYITDNFARERIIACLTKIQIDCVPPDVIIVEFPRIIYWIDLIKNLFPLAKVVASCHDVSFQSVERYFLQTKINRYFSRFYLNKYRSHEIQVLNKFDLIVVLNDKDKSLLSSQPLLNSNKVMVISPFYDYYNINVGSKKNDIVFFGAMGRIENIQAINWFLLNVWSELSNKLPNARLKLVGGGLSDANKNEYQKYSNVDIEGFVSDPVKIFDNCFCFIVPLQLGAGIKIKVLDAMNSGIPVVTNTVGIEGIPAMKDRDYLHAEDAKSFLNQIVKLNSSPTLQESLSRNAKDVIVTNFNYENSYRLYVNGIFALLNKELY